jgi:hypothetical protein
MVWVSLGLFSVTTALFLQMQHLPACHGEENESRSLGQLFLYKSQFCSFSKIYEVFDRYNIENGKPMTASAVAESGALSFTWIISLSSNIIVLQMGIGS